MSYEGMIRGRPFDSSVPVSSRDRELRELEWMVVEEAMSQVRKRFIDGDVNFQSALKEVIKDVNTTRNTQAGLSQANNPFEEEVRGDIQSRRLQDEEHIREMV
jgi:hypothetical protein